MVQKRCFDVIISMFTIIYALLKCISIRRYKIVIMYLCCRPTWNTHACYATRFLSVCLSVPYGTSNVRSEYISINFHAQSTARYTACESLHQTAGDARSVANVEEVI